MLGLTENNFLGQKRGQGAVDHKAVYAKTLRMMNSKYTNAFKLEGGTRRRFATPTAGARSARAA